MSWKFIARYSVVFIGAFLIASTKIPFFDGVYCRISVEDPDNAKLWALIIGGVIQTLYFPIRYEFERAKKERFIKTYRNNLALLAAYRRFALNQRFKVNKEFDRVSFRFFIPNRKFSQPLAKFLGMQIKYKYVRIDEIVETVITPELSFIVHPEKKSQGLVGKCYQEESLNIKNGVILQDDVEYVKFNNRMNQTQVNESQGHVFVSTFPVAKNSRYIECIIAIDCKSEIPCLKDSKQKDIVELYEVIKDFYYSMKPILKNIR